MGNSKNFNNETGDDSLTPTRPATENIRAGAGHDDQLDELKENAKAHPTPSEQNSGTSPSAYPGPADGE